MPESRNRELYKIARYYHDTCESYDQNYCSGTGKNGEAMPVGPE